MGISMIDSYIVDGKLYVTTKFLSAYFEKSDKQIGRWKKDGLPIANKDKGIKVRGDFYCLKSAIEWVDRNINKTKSRATQARGQEVDISSMDDGDIDETVNDINGKIKQANEMLQLKGKKATQYEEAERVAKIVDALTKAVKLGEQTKELIPKKDTEKVIVEFAAMLISGYKRDIKILPKECANRPEDEIRAILETTYKTNIEKYQKIAKSDMLTEAKVYDIIEVVVELIQEDVSLDEILKRIKDES